MVFNLLRRGGFMARRAKKNTNAVTKYMACHMSWVRASGANGLKMIATNKNSHMVTVLSWWCACNAVMSALPDTIQLIS